MTTNYDLKGYCAGTLRAAFMVGACALAGQAAYCENLADAFKLALANDPRFAATRAETSAAQEVEQQAFAQLLPSVYFNGTVTNNQTDSQLPGYTGAPINNSYQYVGSSASLNFRQPIYRKYSYAAWEQTKSQVEIAQITLTKSFSELAVRTCAAYFDLLMTRDQLQLIRAQGAAIASQLDYARLAFAAGQGTRTDIDEAQARLDMVASNVVDAESRFSQSRRALEAIVNRPVVSVSALSVGRLTVNDAEPNDPASWIAMAKENNFDLRVARANLEYARLELEKASSGHHPTVDLIASRSKSSNANDVSINQQYMTTSIGFQVNIPLYSGGYYSSQQRQASFNYDKVSQQYELANREVETQLRKELQNISDGVARARALERSRASSEQAVLSTKKGIQAGTRSRMDLVNAQQQQLTVERDLSQARYQYIMARARLLNLVGTFGEAEISMINEWLEASS